jgi:oligogalacturonide transporter
MKKQRNIISKLSYACGDIYGGGAFLLIGVLYLNFLTDIVGLEPALAGSIFFLGKIWDAISDPLMGVISDNTKSKYGRRRIYFLIGILPIFLSFAMLWFTLKTDSVVAMYLYYLISYLFLNTTLTLVMIPYNSILPSMTSDYNERTSFITIRLVFSNIAALISAVLPMIVVNMFSNLTTGYAYMGIIFGLFYAIPYLLLFFGTYENDYNSEKEISKYTISMFLEDYKATFKNKSFRIYSGFYIAGQTAVDFIVTLFIFYLTYNLNLKELFPVVLGLLLIVQIISMPIHMKISKKYGKTTPMKIGLPIWTIALVISLFIDSNSSTIYIFLIAILSGFGCSASIFVPWSVFPELADIDELITGKRREGIYSGLSNLIRKMAQAIALFLIGISLDLIGYIPNVEQSPQTLLGIKSLFGIAPIFFIVIALYYSSKYKLTEEKYELIKSHLGKKDKKNTDLKTKSVCEEVTGIEYSDLKTS